MYICNLHNTEVYINNYFTDEEIKKINLICDGIFFAKSCKFNDNKTKIYAINIFIYYKYEKFLLISHDLFSFQYDTFIYKNDNGDIIYHENENNIIMFGNIDELIKHMNNIKMSSKKILYKYFLEILDFL